MAGRRRSHPQPPTGWGTWRSHSPTSDYSIYIHTLLNPSISLHPFIALEPNIHGRYPNSYYIYKLSTPPRPREVSSEAGLDGLLRTDPGPHNLILPLTQMIRSVSYLYAQWQSNGPIRVPNVGIRMAYSVSTCRCNPCAANPIA